MHDATMFEIIQNVLFDFFCFGIFHQVWTCLVTLFDRKLQVSEIRQN